MTSVLTHVIVAARILYAQYWKSLSIPSEEMLFQKICECIEMDKLTMILNGQSDVMFISKWQGVYNFIAV